MRFYLACVFVLLAFSASAHIVADPAKAPAGTYFKTNLRVTHGCDGQATTAITVTVPKDITMIRPQAKPGWKITIDKHKLDEPVKGPHGPITEVMTRITWSGGTLEDAHFDEFGLSMKLPDKTGTLAFPVLQQCGKTRRNWNQIPREGQAWHELESPAPLLAVMPNEASAHAHH